MSKNWYILHLHYIEYPLFNEYKYKVIRHSAKQYVDDTANTNGIENF